MEESLIFATEVITLPYIPEIIFTDEMRGCGYLIILMKVGSTTVEELDKSIIDELKKLNNDVVMNLCNSFHSRIETCIKIKYQTLRKKFM